MSVSMLAGPRPVMDPDGATIVNCNNEIVYLEPYSHCQHHTIAILPLTLCRLQVMCYCTIVIHELKKKKSQLVSVEFFIDIKSLFLSE